MRFPCIVSVVEQHPHRMCVGGSIPSAWVTEDMRMNDFLKFFDVTGESIFTNEDAQTTILSVEEMVMMRFSYMKMIRTWNYASQKHTLH